MTRIDALFDIERTINGESAERRLAVRQERSAPLVAELEEWMRTERAGLSRHAAVAKAMDYMLKRWDGFARFLDDGRICMTNNAAERALRGICLGRKSWLFAGSDRGGERAAVMYTLIGTAKLNDVDPQAWLADVLDRIAEMPQTRLHEPPPLALEGRPAAGPGRVAGTLHSRLTGRPSDSKITPHEMRPSPDAYGQPATSPSGIAVGLRRLLTMHTPIGADHLIAPGRQDLTLTWSAGIWSCTEFTKSRYRFGTCKNSSPDMKHENPRYSITIAGIFWLRG